MARETKRKQTLEAAMPGLWEELRTWLIETCARINAQFSEPILSVDKSRQSQLDIEQKKPHSKLSIELEQRENRFHCIYGRGCSGDLKIDTDDSGALCVLDETGRRMYRIEEIGTKLWTCWSSLARKSVHSFHRNPVKYRYRWFESPRSVYVIQK